MTNTYKEHAARLRSHARSLEKDMELLRQSMSYYDTQLMGDREKLRILGLMKETMEETAEALNLLDGAGITLKKPDTTGIKRGDRDCA